MTMPRLPGDREQRLLLNCARVRMDEALEADTASILEQPLDWDAVLFFARLHSTASLLHLHVRRLDAARPSMSSGLRIPDRVRRRLLQLAHRTTYQNRIFSDENARLVSVFDEARVPVIIQKGLSVVELLYGSLQLRPLIDLVYLVPAEDVGSARRALGAHGYSERTPSTVEGIYRWCCPQLHLVRQAELRIAVRLQWNLVNWPRLHRLHAADVWGRARAAEVSGRRVLVLSPADLVIHLCLQADNQGFFNRTAADISPATLLFAELTNNRLVRFTDIHQAIDCLSGEIRWDEVVDRARESGTEEAVFSSLSLTHSLLNTHIGQGVLEQLRIARTRGVRRWLFLATQAETHSGGRAARIVGAAWRRASSRQRLRAIYLLGLAEYAFPDRGRLAAHYGIGSRAGEVGVLVFHAVRTVLRSAVAFGILIARKSVGRLGLPTRLFDGGWMAVQSPRGR